MITRRTFLKALVIATSGLILPDWIVRAENQIEIEAEPLLEPPTRSESTIYATDWGDGNYQLALDPMKDPPEITWREYFVWHNKSTTLLTLLSC